MKIKQNCIIVINKLKEIIKIENLGNNSIFFEYINSTKENSLTEKRSYESIVFELLNFSKQYFFIEVLILRIKIIWIENYIFQNNSIVKIIITFYKLHNIGLKPLFIKKIDISFGIGV